MAVKEVIIAKKGNVVFKKNINLGMKGKGVRASKPHGGGSKITYWVYVLPNMYPMKGFSTKLKAEKFYNSFFKKKKVKTSTKKWNWMHVRPKSERYEEVWDNRITGERIFLHKRKNGLYGVTIDGRKRKYFKYKKTALSYVKLYQTSY